jgi:phosphoribosylglycinamide formyltransferase-1
VSFGVGVLASGAGTNLQALLDRVHGQGGVEILGVGSDKDDAPALDRARQRGVPVAAFGLDAHPDREARDAAMGEWLTGLGVELVVLAGFMQLVTPGFLARFPDRVVNVHPALLPAFPGIKAVEQALDYGVKVFGVTVHFVDEGVDTGRIIGQRAVELPHATDPATVRAALQPVEHDLLCGAVEAIAAGRVRFDPDHPRRVLVAERVIVPRP